MMHIALIAVVASTMPAQSSGTPAPPREALTTRVEGGESFLVTKSPWNGVSYRVILEPKRTDIEWQTVLSLFYGPSELPGLPAIPGKDTGSHTHVSIGNDGTSASRAYRTVAEFELEDPPRIPANLLPPPGTPSRYRPFERVIVRLVIRPTRQEKTAPPEETLNSAPGAHYWQPYGPLPSGLSLGDWHSVLDVGETFQIGFGRGRVGCHVHRNTTTISVDKAKLEAIAWGIDYRILLDPILVDSPSKRTPVYLAGRPASIGEATGFVGVAVAPAELFDGLGVRTRTEGADSFSVTFTAGGRSVTLRSLSWEMETPKGKVKLDRPVFPYKGQLIVPLRQVAEALGFTVAAEEGRITLTPPR
ncbi:MAG: hypothetical protein IH851_07575 [Armatimonadetes bacterium]|nr:hypothetical protein [Armatimonadota bacterium]